MTVPRLAIVVSPRGWAEPLHRFVADHGGGVVRARVLDAREALDEEFDVLVIEDVTSFLSARLVTELHARGRSVIGLHDPDEPFGGERLHRLGVDVVATIDEDPETLLDLAAALTSLREATPVHKDGRSRPDSSGTLVAVASPAGAPGATELAVGLAGAAASQRSTLLVDLDWRSPAVAQRLQLPTHPNLAVALDAVEQGDVVRRACHSLDDLRVLVGTPGVDDLRASALRLLLDDLRSTHEVVVADLGSIGQSVSQAQSDVLSAADVVIGVTHPTPVMVTRFVGFAETVTANTDKPIDLVLNRLPRAAFVRDEVIAEITRSVPTRSIACLPESRNVRRQAWDGRLVSRGRFARQLSDLARSILTREAVAA